MSITYRLAGLLLPLGLSLGSPIWAQGGPAPGLQQRIAAKLAGDPALAASLGRPGSDMAAAAWLVGTWEVRSDRMPSSEVGTAIVEPVLGGTWLEFRGAYPGGLRDIGFVGYNPATGKWQSLTVDNMGNANITEAAGWEQDRLAFEGDLVIFGIPARVRQTVTRVGDDEFRIVTEELAGGEWRQMDLFRFVRQDRPKAAQTP